MKKKQFDYFGTLAEMSLYATEEAKFLKETLVNFDPVKL